VGEGNGQVLKDVVRELIGEISNLRKYERRRKLDDILDDGFEKGGAYKSAAVEVAIGVILQTHDNVVYVSQRLAEKTGDGFSDKEFLNFVRKASYGQTGVCDMDVGKRIVYALLDFEYKDQKAGELLDKILKLDGAKDLVRYAREKIAETAMDEEGVFSGSSIIAARVWADRLGLEVRRAEVAEGNGIGDVVEKTLPEKRRDVIINDGRHLEISFWAGPNNVTKTEVHTSSWGVGSAHPEKPRKPKALSRNPKTVV